MHKHVTQISSLSGELFLKTRLFPSDNWIYSGLYLNSNDTYPLSKLKNPHSSHAGYQTYTTHRSFLITSELSLCNTFHARCFLFHSITIRSSRESIAVLHLSSPGEHPTRKAEGPENRFEIAQLRFSYCMSAVVPAPAWTEALTHLPQYPRAAAAPHPVTHRTVTALNNRTKHVNLRTEERIVSRLIYAADD